MKKRNQKSPIQRLLLNLTNHHQRIQATRKAPILLTLLDQLLDVLQQDVLAGLKKGAGARGRLLVVVGSVGNIEFYAYSTLKYFSL